ncbi:MAG: hypothetical protein IT374_25190, partial [Polyangiaceae bacterium]|nr:hypothetical protein [Polyangiaceae bacterium]
MRALVIGASRVVVGDRELVGAGGEAEVFSLPDGRVAKVFTTPTALHAQKIAALIALAPRLPPEIVTPDEPVVDERGAVVGYAMERVTAPLAPLAELLRRPSFAAHGLPERAAVLLRLLGAVRAVHALGVVVGDLSDQNVLADPASGAVRIIDADSFQVGRLPCPVQTEAYVDPARATSGPLTPADDEYALHVLATRLLLGVHPWGGAHPSLPTFAARARARVFVTDAGVTYPSKVAQPPRSIGAPLLAALGAYFRGEARGPLPGTAFAALSLTAVRCLACGASGVPDQGACPACAASTPLPRSAARDGDARELEGPIEWLDAVGDTIAVAVRGRGGARVHVAVRGVWRALPRDPSPAPACVLLDEVRLAVAEGARIEVWDLATARVAQVTSTELGWGGPVVARLAGGLVRSSGGQLVAGDVVLGRPVERVIGGALSGQARASSSAPSAGRVVVATRLGRQVLLERIGLRGRAPLPLPPLAGGEALVELEILDDGATTLCARLVRDAGVSFVRYDLFGPRGALASSSRVIEGAHPTRVGVAGRALRGAVVLHPTPAGLVREQLVHGRVGAVSLIDGTEGVVDEGALLVARGADLVVALDR